MNVYESFTERARMVMRLANEEAQSLGHEYIGTEHILLGLVQEGSGVAAQVLKEVGIDSDKIRRAVEMIVLSNADAVTNRELPLTPSAAKAVEACTEEAERFGDSVETEHLLLGLLCHPDSIGYQILINLLVDIEDIIKQVQSRSELC
jgi:ATP-dependent Clp protease ATP-binding subunit ClpC